MGVLRRTAWLVVAASVAALLSPPPPPAHPDRQPGFLVAASPLFPPAAIRRLSPHVRPLGGPWWWSPVPPPPPVTSEPVRRLRASEPVRFEPLLVSDGPALDVSSLWPRTRGEGVVVAVIDSGVDLAHPGLAGRIWSNAGEVCGNGVDDDGNGFVDDCHGWDFVSGSPDPSPHPLLGGHGTHVAGLIVGSFDGWPPASGVAPSAQVMPLRFMVGSSGDTADAVSAITYAVANGADVLNLSWGSFEPSEALEERIRWAVSQGVVVVAAAGNQGVDVSATPFYPASYDIPGVVSVAAVSRDGALAPFSNFGGAGPHPGPDVAAPGVSVLSLLPGGGVAPMSGTSMAAPQVAGLAALLLSDPLSAGFSPAEVEDRLVSAASETDVPLPVRSRAPIDPSRLLLPPPFPSPTLRLVSAPRLPPPPGASPSRSATFVVPAATPAFFEVAFPSAPSSVPRIDGLVAASELRLWGRIGGLVAEVAYPDGETAATLIPVPRLPDPLHRLSFQVSFPHEGEATLSLLAADADGRVRSPLPLVSVPVFASSSPGTSSLSPLEYDPSRGPAVLTPAPVSVADPPLCGDPDVVAWVRLPDSASGWRLSAAGSSAHVGFSVFPPAGDPFCVADGSAAPAPSGSLVAAGAHLLPSHVSPPRLRLSAVPSDSPPSPALRIHPFRLGPTPRFSEGEVLTVDVPASRPLWRDGSWQVLSPDGRAERTFPAARPLRLHLSSDGFWVVSLTSPTGRVYAEVSVFADNLPPQVLSARLVDAASGPLLSVEAADIPGEVITLSAFPLPGFPSPPPVSVTVPETGVVSLELPLRPASRDDLMWAPPPWWAPSLPLSVPFTVSDGASETSGSARSAGFVPSSGWGGFDCVLVCG